MLTNTADSDESSTKIRGASDHSQKEASSVEQFEGRKRKVEKGRSRYGLFFSSLHQTYLDVGDAMIQAIYSL